MTQISDFGYSSPKEIEGKESKESKSDPIGGNSISNITGKKKEVSPSQAMLIGTARIFARAGQLNQGQIDGIGAGLRAPSFGGSPAKKAGAEGEKKAEEPKGGQFKVNVGEQPKEAGVKADSKTIKPGIKAYAEFE